MRAEDLTHALRGVWRGRYGTARCPAHDDQTPSLSIANGDNGQLLLKCHAGCEFHAIKAAIEGRLNPTALLRTRGTERLPVPKCDSTRVLQPLLQRIWAESHELTGTLAEDYLRNRAVVGPLPGTLRFHPRLRHPTGRRFPAMVARVDDTSARMSGLHRTYLDENIPIKAETVPVKAMLGPCQGCAVRLRSGFAGLVVCEGIETGLSLRDALDNEQSVWAALSTSGLAGLQLPTPKAYSRKLLIACDGDAVGLRAGEQIGTRAAALGWQVELIAAPHGEDFNDVAMEKAHG